MNRNVLIVLVGGVLIALLVGVLVSATLGGPKQEVASAVVEVPKVDIVVAVKALPVGAELSADNMKWQKWPKDAVFPGAVVRKGDGAIDEALNGRLSRAVAEGEPLTKAALVSETKGNFLAASLEDGMRAVAIDIKAGSAVAGFAGPGDYVDVILTYKASIGVDRGDEELTELVGRNLDRWATETILQNVRVLAVDQKYERDDEEVKVGKTVTLEVDRKGAEVLSLAAEMGTLGLALRKLGDEAQEKDMGPVTTDARITNIFDEVYDQIDGLEEKSGRDGRGVRVYNGEVVVRQSVMP